VPLNPTHSLTHSLNPEIGYEEQLRFLGRFYQRQRHIADATGLYAPKQLVVCVIAATVELAGDESVGVYMKECSA